MFIHLDPRRPDVLVPKGFMGQPQLVLQVGLNMAIPIPDLKIDEGGISCTLSFNRAPFWCRRISASSCSSVSSGNFIPDPAKSFTPLS